MENSKPIMDHCPECLKIVPFTSGETNFVKCQCGKIIERRFDGLLYVHPDAPLEGAAGAIQPGSAGSWDSQPFRVVGRIRVWFQEAVINYWSLIFDDGSLLLLEEAYGMYAVMKKAAVPQSISSADVYDLKIGSKRSLEKSEDFILEQKNNIHKWELEGEAFWPEFPLNIKVVDFSSAAANRYVIMQGKTLKKWAFEYYPVLFDELQLANLRIPEAKPFEFGCHKCAARITIIAYPYANSCACSQCGTWYAVDPKKGLIKAKANTVDYTPVLGIGSKGILKGVEYTITGCSQKQEVNIYKSKWREYTLYNSNEGFAFLSEFDGHWVFLKETEIAPVLLTEEVKELVVDGELFVLFNAYKYTVTWAAGEFPYNIFDNQETSVKEYISPPEIWIREKNPVEGIRWYSGEHISKRAVDNAFKPEGGLPWQVGVGAIQPKGYMNSGKIGMAALVSILLLMILNFVTAAGKLKKEILNERFPFNDSSNTVSYVTKKFALEKPVANLELHISAPVDNSWFELNATLVNADNGKEYTIAQGVEYYYGYTDGENWSEGGRTEDAYFFAIPEGTYFLQLQGIRDYAIGMPRDFLVLVTYDVPNLRNMWLAILIIILFAFGKYGLSRYHEYRRWSNSPFSEY
jgi:hypothetical protein